MAEVTAFQPNAFQNNAFQIFDNPPTPSDTHDGGHYPRRKLKGYKKQILGNIIRIYKEAAETMPDDRQLLSLVDAYVEPENEEEEARREKAQYLSNKLPAFSRIDFEAMMQNRLAAKKAIEALAGIEQRLQAILTEKQQQEDILMLMFASVLL